VYFNNNGIIGIGVIPNANYSKFYFSMFSQPVINLGVTVNKYVAVGAYTNGKHLYISSEKASLELLDEVMKIVCLDAAYTFFEGELKCVYDYTPNNLLQIVKDYMNAWKDRHHDILKNRSYVHHQNWSKLQEYVKAAEA
jgi:hypothetical protein